MKTDTETGLDKVISWLRSESSLKPEINTLAAVAGLSPHYFHRNFTAMYGISLHTLMRRVRAHRAAWQLAYRHKLPITEIAYIAGYENSESFSRAFKRQTGMTPTAFRRAPDLQRLEALESAIRVLDADGVEDNVQREDNPGVPEIVRFPGITVAELIHCGPPQTLMTSVEAFIAWRKQHGTPPSKSRTFNIFYSNPATSPSGTCRLGIAAVHSGDIDSGGANIHNTEIPSLFCLSWLVTGSEAHLQKNIETVIAASEHVFDFASFPPFIERLRFYPDVSMVAAVNRVYLPVKP